MIRASAKKKKILKNDIGNAAATAAALSGTGPRVLARVICRTNIYKTNELEKKKINNIKKLF